MREGNLLNEGRYSDIVERSLALLTFLLRQGQLSFGLKGTLGSLELLV